MCVRRSDAFHTDRVKPSNGDVSEEVVIQMSPGCGPTEADVLTYIVVLP